LGGSSKTSRLAKGLDSTPRAKAPSVRLLKGIAAGAACLGSICFSFSSASLSLSIVFKLQQTMSLLCDLRNFACFSRQQAQARLCLASKSAASRSCSIRCSLTLRERYSPTRIPLTSHLALRRTYLEQRSEFSLSKTTHLVLFFSQAEQGNISNLENSIHDASALRFRRFFQGKRSASILKEKKGWILFYVLF
jgi:hypothetical protein